MGYIRRQPDGAPVLLRSFGQFPLLVEEQTQVVVALGQGRVPAQRFEVVAGGARVIAAALVEIAQALVARPVG